MPIVNNIGNFREIIIEHPPFGGFIFKCRFENHTVRCYECPYYRELDPKHGKCSLFDVITVHCEKCECIPCALQYVYLVKKLRDLLDVNFKHICCNCYNKKLEDEIKNG